MTETFIEDMEQYLELSEKTEKKFPDGLTLPASQMALIKALFIKTAQTETLFDDVKKIIIYGKTDLVENYLPIEDVDALDDAKMTHLPQQAIEILHHALGIRTEIDEIFSAIAGYILEGKPLDIVNMREELGDIFWYIAGLIRLLGGNPYEIMGINIDKLKERFGDKFSEEDALNRDLDSERSILERGTHPALHKKRSKK